MFLDTAVSGILIPTRLCTYPYLIPLLISQLSKPCSFFFTVTRKMLNNFSFPKHFLWSLWFLGFICNLPWKHRLPCILLKMWLFHSHSPQTTGLRWGVDISLLLIDVFRPFPLCFPWKQWALTFKPLGSKNRWLSFHSSLPPWSFLLVSWRFKSWLTVIL